MKKIFIVVLHYGDLGVTKDCISSVVKYEKSYGQIVVVNNDKKPILNKDLPYKNIKIINNKKNLGFSAGVNIGIKYSLKRKADFILLLNNDTYLEEPFIRQLIDEAKEDSKVGVIGPAIKFNKNGKTIFDVGGKVNPWTGKTSHKEVENTKEYMPHSVTYITGAAMLIKKEVFEKIGLFDENFFLYYEDVDFCLRTKKAGFSTIVVPQISVYHLLSNSAGKVNQFILNQQTKSAIIFGNKYFSSFPKNIFHKIFVMYQSLIFYLLLKL